MSEYFRLVEPFPGVLHIISPNQMMNAKAFMRLQEFYESPLSNENGPFKGRHFERDEYKAAYAASKGTGTGWGEFTYYTDWNGFNVPGNVVDRWLELFTPDPMEYSIMQLVREHRKPGGQYYVIGTHDEIDTITVDHELSHAFWHLDPEYQEEANRLVYTLPVGFRQLMYAKLREMGYTPEVLDDEIAAYLSTDNLHDITDMLGTDDIPWFHMLNLQRHFYRYHEQAQQDAESVDN